jgi:Fe2+ or Zn2+ uptake regulation protein
MAIMKKKTNLPMPLGIDFKWPKTDLIREGKTPLILKNAGLKKTLSRDYVFNVFLKYKVPLTAEMIAQRLIHKDFSLATIYRTLDSFERVGLINRVDLRANSIFYELGGHHHHHIICNSCGTIEELETCLFKTLPPSKKFAQINEHSLEFFGICKKCA